MPLTRENQSPVASRAQAIKVRGDMAVREASGAAHTQLRDLVPGTLDHALTAALPSQRVRRVHGVWRDAVAGLRLAAHNADVLELADDAQRLAAFADQVEAEGAVRVGCEGRAR